MSIPKAHKEKINTAIKICEDSFIDFFKVLEMGYPKEEASRIKYMLLDNTVFVGGIFRSVFTDTKINDVDVFFTSIDAAHEFADRFLKRNPIFNEKQITRNLSFNYVFSKDKPKLSFVTKYANPQKEILNSIDFSFNSHLFKMNTYEMQFDVDTFKKIGTIINPDSMSAVALFFRLLRFQKEGFSFNRAGLIDILASLMRREMKDEAHIDTLELDSLLNAMSSSEEQDFEFSKLSHGLYETDDYFDIGVGKKKVANPYSKYKIYDEVDIVTDNDIALNAMPHPITMQTQTHITDPETWLIEATATTPITGDRFIDMEAFNNFVANQIPRTR